MTCNAIVLHEDFSNETGKRTDYLNWEDYFMAMALLTAKRSKDPCTQVGTCITNAKNRVAGLGYNGMPNGCSDDKYPWTKDPDDKLKTKFTFVVHAEMNSIFNKMSQELTNCRMYVTLFPCNECAKAIIQADIAEIIYLSDKNRAKAEVIAAKMMFDDAGVKYRQYVPSRSQIVLRFDQFNETNETEPEDLLQDLKI